MNLDANNLYGWVMSQKVPIDGFKWVKDLLKLNESSIKNCNENSDRRYFFEVDVEYPKHLFNFHKDFTFLPEKKVRKGRKACLWHRRQKKYFVHIKALKQALNHRLILKKVYRVIQFNQKSWLKPYIDMNTKLRKEAKMDLKMISLS